MEELRVIQVYEGATGKKTTWNQSLNVFIRFIDYIFILFACLVALAGGVIFLSFEGGASFCCDIKICSQGFKAEDIILPRTTI